MPETLYEIQLIELTGRLLLSFIICLCSVNTLWSGARCLLNEMENTSLNCFSRGIYSCCVQIRIFYRCPCCV